MNKRSPTTRADATGGKGHAKKSSPELPPWIAVMVKVCTWIAIPSLIIGGLAGLALVVLILLQRTSSFSALRTIIGIFEFFFATGVLALIAARYTSPAIAWVMGALGVLLAASQLFLFLLAPAFSAKPAEFAGNAAAASLHGIGIFLIIFCTLYLITFYVIGYLTIAKQRRSKQMKYLDASTADATKRSIIPKCWELSRCRPAVRMTCPNYIDRFTCWKRRSGCFCDTKLANYLVSTSGRGEAQEAIDMQRFANKATNQRALYKQNDGEKRTWKEQQQFCHECPLYLEHQEYKYKNLSWISFPITAFIMLAVYPIIAAAYSAGLNELQNYLKDVKMGAFSPDASGLSGGFEFFLFGVLALLLLGYVISMVETCFLRWKW